MTSDASMIGNGQLPKIETATQPILIEQVEASLNAIANDQVPRAQTIGILLASAALFVGLGCLTAPWSIVWILLLVLFVHELGHWIGMKLFGFRNLQMLFIPFVGAMVSGYETNPNRAKAALILLLGPVPGIVLSQLCSALYSVTYTEAFIQLSDAFLYVNFFNLIPLYPLDGGKFLAIISVSRSAKTEMVFQSVTGAVLVWLAFMTTNVILGLFLAGFLLFFVPAAYRANLVADKLGQEIPPVFRSNLEPVAGPYLGRTLELLEPMLPARQRHADIVALYVWAIWGRIRSTTPSSWTVVALLGLYLSSVWMGLVAIWEWD
jgi:Zn-dependent protease